MTGLEIERALAAGKLDLGIGFAPSILESTEVEPILEEELLLVVGPSHELAGRKEVQVKALNGARMILLDPSFSTRKLIDHYPAMRNARPHVMYETNSMEVMLGAVAESNISTIIPERALRKNEDRFLAMRLRNPSCFGRPHCFGRGTCFDLYRPEPLPRCSTIGLSKIQIYRGILEIAATEIHSTPASPQIQVFRLR